jgi:hypothetical protein
MTKIDRDHLHTDVAWVAERLEQERPTATPLELDRIQLRAQAQAARQGRSQAKGSLLKSRVAITAVLMLGLFTGGTGTTLALSGSSASDEGSAAQAQYPRGGGGNNVLGQQEQGGQGGQGGQANPGGNVLGTTQSSPGAVQGSQQVVATQGGSSLPFTGLAAIPIIILGLALLGAGALMFRSTRQSPSGA